MKTIDGTGFIATISEEDIFILEGMFAVPSVVDDQMVYTIPDWLVFLREQHTAQATA